MDQELLAILACPACRGGLESVPLFAVSGKTGACAASSASSMPGAAAEPCGSSNGAAFASPDATDETDADEPETGGSRGAVLPGRVEGGLLCAACAAVYPVCGGIPVLLKEEAVPLNLWELGRQKNNLRRK